MKSKNIKIINFSSSGGIKQFSKYLIDKCNIDDIDVLNSNNLKEIFLFIKKFQKDSTFVFTNNNMKIYYCMLLGLSFNSILILHDHKLRKGAKTRDKLLNFFVYKFINKFNKVIIHQNEESLLKNYKNISYQKMPYHNGEIKILNKNKINLLFFGRIEFYKNLDMLIEAFSIGNLNSQYNLVIAGSGNISNDSIEKINKCNITFINQFIDDRTRDILIEWCHYFVLPYNSLTQTGIVDLAGYYKKPSLVSNIEGFNCYKGMHFNNTLDITNINTLVNSFINIYKDYFINYNSAQEEAFRLYNNSINEWENYKKLIETIK